MTVIWVRMMVFNPVSARCATMVNADAMKHGMVVAIVAGLLGGKYGAIVCTQKYVRLGPITRVRLVTARRVTTHERLAGMAMITRTVAVRTRIACRSVAVMALVRAFRAWATFAVRRFRRCGYFTLAWRAGVGRVADAILDICTTIQWPRDWSHPFILQVCASRERRA